MEYQEVKNPNVEVVVLTPREYARSKMSEEEFIYFDKIITKESNWIHTAANPKSTARGLCQTMMSIHKDVSGSFIANPYEQIDWCIKYIENRYGKPSVAWSFHLKNNWF